MTFEEYFGNWSKIVDRREIDKVTNKLISMYGRIDKCVTPASSDWFRAFTLCRYEDLKVVFIGYDPYPQKGVATGILFGNRKDTLELSPSLQIVKDSCINLEIPHNSIIFDPTLESWAKQGILMINSSFTTEIGKTGSHCNIWRPFVTKFVRSLSEWNTGIIYVLFGEHAKHLKPYINQKMNIVLEEKHPAYYARTGNKMPSTIFETVSRLTREKYCKSITWFEEY